MKIKTFFTAIATPPLLALVAASEPAASDREQSASRNVFEREGLRVEFSVTSTSNIEGKLYRDDIARMMLSITDSETGEPVTGLYPAGWIDPVAEEEIGDARSCRNKAGTYLSGYIGVRPMIDLNSYYVVVLNSDPTIAVIDPIVGIRGITQLLTQIILPAPAEDWARSLDEKSVYVAIPTEDVVSVVDLNDFRLSKSIKVGDRPTRVAVQPDGRYVWIGHVGSRSGISVIDPDTLSVVTSVETGEGHHEFAFSSDGRYAYVSNSKAGTVSVIDISSLELTGTLSLNGTPISLGYSSLSEALYVVDGTTGEIIVYNPDGKSERRRITLEPGLGPIRFTPDGRYGIVVNPALDKVYAIDAAQNSVAHEVDIEGGPFQVAYSRRYAFIRALNTNRVSMIPLKALTSNEPIPLVGFTAGERPPSDSPRLLVSDLFAPAATEAATLSVSPGDATVYFYMEGMNAPMGNFRNYGHRPVSAMVADRTIKEVSPGKYLAAAKIPAAGDFQFIMTMDAPQLIECFHFRSEVNPKIAEDIGPARIQYETQNGSIANEGQPFTVRFRITDPRNEDSPLMDAEIRVVTYRSPGLDREEHAAQHKGDGIYEVVFTPNSDGAYYAYPSIPSLDLGYSELPFITIISRKNGGTG